MGKLRENLWENFAPFEKFRLGGKEKARSGGVIIKKAQKKSPRWGGGFISLKDAPRKMQFWLNKSSCNAWFVGSIALSYFFDQHDSPSNLAESRYPPQFLRTALELCKGRFYRSSTETDFAGIWMYLRRDVDIFSIWAFLRALRQRILRGSNNRYLTLFEKLCGTAYCIWSVISSISNLNR